MGYELVLFWLVIAGVLVLFTNHLARANKRENEARDCYTASEEDLIEDNQPIKENYDK